jgi:hypothetical protein
MLHRFIMGGLTLVGLVQPALAYDVRTRLELEPLIVKHAAANSVPAPLVHRVIMRESRYNPRAVGRGGALGLMQIKHGTARALGYGGPASGLLDAETNLIYGVRYLAGAYRVADGDHNRAVGFYARGYYYDAKRRGMLRTLARGPAAPEEFAVPVAAAQPAQQPSVFSLMFAPSRAPEAAQEAAQAALAEPEAPVPQKRISRSGKRQDAKTPAQLAAATGEPTQEAMQSVEAPALNPGVARKRSSRVVKRNEAKASAPTTPGQGDEVLEAVGTAVNRTEAPIPPKRSRAGKQNDVNTPAQSNAAQGEPAQTGRLVVSEDVRAPATRSGRSAKPSGAAGADRSARRVSAQPGDPGRHP